MATMTGFPKRTLVVIVGGGPAGSLLALMLHGAGVAAIETVGRLAWSDNSTRALNLLHGVVRWLS